MNTQDAKRVLETALICAQQPLPLREMRTLFADEVGPDTLRALLDELVRDWEGRGVELVPLSTGWRFQSRPEMREYLDRLNPEKPPKYSRAVMETLAIIAYRQPVTRGDIEDIRGVTVASQIVNQLEDRGWVETIGYREAPGRPALLATTRQFLDDLGLASLEQLPVLDPAGNPAAALDGVVLDAQAPLALDEAARPAGVEDGPTQAPVAEANGPADAPVEAALSDEGAASDKAAVSDKAAATSQAAVTDEAVVTSEAAASDEACVAPASDAGEAADAAPATTPPSVPTSPSTESAADAASMERQA